MGSARPWDVIYGGVGGWSGSNRRNEYWSSRFSQSQWLWILTTANKHPRPRSLRAYAQGSITSQSSDPNTCHPLRSKEVHCGMLRSHGSDTHCSLYPGCPTSTRCTPTARQRSLNRVFMPGSVRDMCAKSAVSTTLIISTSADSGMPVTA